MEHILRCNYLKCRKQLGDKALVTTCSHIFCPDCAAGLGLAGRGHDHRPSCPACKSALTHPDDAVVALLNPSEDYKTSVLSGLTPHTIIEIASRGLSFWAYQTTQEVVYQEHLGKKLTEKYSGLSIQLDSVINQANSEITNLQNKLNSMTIDQDTLQKKNDELFHAYKEKNRKLLQVQELYDKLKQKAMLGQVQGAAEDAADSTVHGGQTGFVSFDVASLGQGQLYEQAHRENMPDVGRQAAFQSQAMGPPPLPPRSFGAPNGHHADVPFTPSTHRQRLGESNVLGTSAAPALMTNISREGAHSGILSASGSLRSPRHITRYPGVGLSSGLKVSQGGHTDGIAAPSNVPRATLRPIPTSSSMSQRLYAQPKSGLGTFPTH